MSPALVDPLPLRVGISLDPAVRDYVFHDRLIGIRYKIGDAMMSTFFAAFRASFSEVVELSESTQQRPAAIDGFVELTGTVWRRDPNCSATDLSADFTVSLRDATGATVQSWTTTQSVAESEITGDPGESFRRRIGIYESEPTHLIEKGAAAFLREFRDTPAIRRWLEAARAYRPSLPNASSLAALPPPGPALYVTSDVESDSMRRCIIEGLRARIPERRVVIGPAVRRALYPWLSDHPPTPIAIERLTALVRWEEARRRLDELDIGTFVLVTGATTQEAHGLGACGAGFGAGGCFGLYWGDRKSVLAAQILELSQLAQVTEAAATRSGTAILPMFLLPLPFIPRTQSAACDAVSKALVETLRSSPDAPTPDR